jgi:hypothetical protein
MPATPGGARTRRAERRDAATLQRATMELKSSARRSIAGGLRNSSRPLPRRISTCERGLPYAR